MPSGWPETLAILYIFGFCIFLIGLWPAVIGGWVTYTIIMMASRIS